MKPIAALRRYFANVERSRQMLEEIREGVANLTDVTNRHLMRLAEVMEAGNRSQALTEIRAGIVNLAETTNQRLGELAPKLNGSAQKSDAFGPQHALPPSSASTSLSIDSVQQRAPFPTAVHPLSGGH